MCGWMGGDDLRPSSPLICKSHELAVNSKARSSQITPVVKL